jgi:hypothetical protein
MKDSDYFYRLKERVERLEKYKNRPCLLTVKLLWWLLRNSVTPTKKAAVKKQIRSTSLSNDQESLEKTISIRDAKCLNIAVFEGGGIGDALIQSLYIKK